MILLIDNAGAFTHSLKRAFVQAGARVRVVAFDKLKESDVRQAHAVVVSAGPNDETALEANVLILRDIDTQLPVLGIGLGMRALVEAHGGRFVTAEAPSIGATDEVIHDETALFEGVPSPLVVGRYDALVLDEDTLPDGWTVSAHTLDGAVIGVRRDNTPHEGILFQPTSVLTHRGADVIANFIESIPVR